MAWKQNKQIWCQWNIWNVQPNKGVNRSSWEEKVFAGSHRGKEINHRLSPLKKHPFGICCSSWCPWSFWLASCGHPTSEVQQPEGSPQNWPTKSPQLWRSLNTFPLSSSSFDLIFDLIVWSPSSRHPRHQVGRQSLEDLRVAASFHVFEASKTVGKKVVQWSKVISNPETKQTRN